MALMPSFYTTTKTNSKKKKAANSYRNDPEYKAFLKRMGVKGYNGERTAEVPSLKVENSVPLSDTIPGGSFSKKDIHSMTKNESKKVADEIRRKATCVAPAYNKGAYQFITEGTDLHTLGKKV